MLHIIPIFVHILRIFHAISSFYAYNPVLIVFNLSFYVICLVYNKGMLYCMVPIVRPKICRMPSKRVGLARRRVITLVGKSGRFLPRIKMITLVKKNALYL